MQVVYADVLIILNTYVNFALLRLASLITGSNASRLRILLSALFGGVYSLIILADGVPPWLSLLLKAAATALMTLIAFGYKNFLSYAKRFSAFLFASFLFAGLMFALWVFVKPETMVYNNATVYFGFDTMTLLIATTACYAVLRVLCLAMEKKAPKGHIYEITVYIAGRAVKLNALLDSGSSLRDFFTALPIIAVDGSEFGFLPDSITEMPSDLKPRLVPINTVSGDGTMLTVRPDRVRIRGVGCDFETKDLLIGLSRSKIKNGDFEAVLPYGIMEQRGVKNHV